MISLVTFQMEGLDEVVLVTLAGPDWSLQLKPRAWQRCKYMKGMMEVHPGQDRFEIKDQEVHMTPAVMAKVGEWLKEYESKEPTPVKCPLASLSLKDSMSAWDEKFVDMPPPDVLRLLFVANYMGIEPLAQVAAAKQANQLQTMGFNELLKTFGVEECPPEDIRRVREEFPEFFACFKQ